MPDLRDIDIWDSFKKGDEWALSYIYRRNCGILYNYGLKFTSDYALIEDTIQELFSGMIRNRQNLGNTDNILFYLLKSFKRNLLRRLQAKKRFEPSDSIEGNSFDVIWSVEQDIILEEFSQEKTRILVLALQELSPREKEAVYLRFYMEQDYNVIADIMEISVESCRNLICKAIKSLRKSLSGNG